MNTEKHARIVLLIRELENHFPELYSPDDEMNGGDTVQTLCDWYAFLKEQLAEYRPMIRKGGI